MCKKIKKIFLRNLTFEKFLEAEKRARKNKTSKTEIIKYQINLENNLINLINKIKNGSYSLGKYREFTVKEPKQRIIKSLPYEDRIVHQWYVEEFIKPYIMPKFIYSNCACIPNKGTHFAVDIMQKYIKKYNKIYKEPWVLKCDISKFFYSIDQEILYQIMNKYIDDKMILDITSKFIFDNFLEDKIGIPIGNYTSQFFGNIYLNELDKYVKYELNVKPYVRYMDDFILILPNKEKCIEYMGKISIFLDSKLHLKFNSKSKYFKIKEGIDFCGYRIWDDYRLLRKSSKYKIKRNIKNWNKLWENNKINFKKVLASLNSWSGHISHCNSYRLKCSIYNKCEFIYKENNFKEF